jgi:hypothetical protein
MGRFLVVSFQLSVVGFQFSVVGCRLSVFSFQFSVFSFQFSVARRIEEDRLLAAYRVDVADGSIQVI